MKNIRTRIMHIMMCALLLVGGAFMLNTPTDVAAATQPQASFRLLMQRTIYDGEYWQTPIDTATVAFYRNGVRVATVNSVDGDIVFDTTIPGNYAFRVIYAPGYVIPDELVPLGYFDGANELFVVKGVVLVSVYGEITATFIFTATEYENRRQGITPSTFALYRGTTRVETLSTDRFGISLFATHVPGRYYVRLIYAPGFNVPDERIFLGHFDGRTSLVVPEVEFFLHPTRAAVITAPPVQDSSAPRILRFAIGNATFTDNSVPHVVEAAPFVAQGRTMVPLRAIVEAFGSEDVAFSSGVITFSIGEQAFTMTIGQALIGADGAYMGTPVTVSGRTFVPLRFIIDNLDAEVRWDGANQAAYIYI